jgi:hypothetical protein
VNRRRALAALTGIAALPFLAACPGGTQTEDCDEDDLAEGDEDCDDDSAKHKSKSSKSKPKSRSRGRR